MTASNPQRKRLRVDELVRDPILPPRILDPERQQRLRESMEVTLKQPLIVRSPPQDTDGRPLWRIADGYRRWLGAIDLDWDEIDVEVRDDLTDQEVLLLAYQADEQSQPRSYLETAWYWVRLKEAGMVQEAIAERESVSTGKVSMYVRVGKALTPERIESAGVDLAKASALAVTQLSEIARASDSEIDDLLATAVAAGEEPPESEEEEEPNFEWAETARGAWKATGKQPDMALWSPEEREEFIRSLGPRIVKASELQGMEATEVIRLRKQLQETGRREIVELREQHAEKVTELADQTAKLALELSRVAAPRISYSGAEADHRGARAPLAAVRRTLKNAWARVASFSLSAWFASIIEPGDSIVEEQLKIEFD